LQVKRNRQYCFSGVRVELNRSRDERAGHPVKSAIHDPACVFCGKRDCRFADISDGDGFTVVAQAKDCLFLEVHYYPYVYLLGVTARAAFVSFRALTRQGKLRIGWLRAHRRWTDEHRSERNDALTSSKHRKDPSRFPMLTTHWGYKQPRRALGVKSA